MLTNYQTELSVEDIPRAAHFLVHTAEAVIHAAMRDMPDSLQNGVLSEELITLSMRYLTCRESNL